MRVAVLRLLRPLPAVVVLAAAAPSFAAQRTFVASNGIDGNACSVVAPCRTFTRALTQTSPKGEIVVLDSAAYGPVTIAQSVSIVAPTGIYAGISVFSANGVTIAAGGADKVVLRGLTINGQGGSIGIDFVQGAQVRVENCVVSNMASNGIQHTAAGGELIILDTIVRDNGGTGILMSTDGNLLLDGVRVEHNAGDGVSALAATGTASASIRNSVMSYNGQGGFAAIRPGPGARTSAAIESSMMTGNSGDGVFVGSIYGGDADVSLTRNTISGNHLSGVSVFDGNGSAGYVKAWLAGNLFSHNVNNAVKVDGAFAESDVSKSMFDEGISFATFNKGVQKVYGDNSGWPQWSGVAPFSVGTF